VIVWKEGKVIVWKEGKVIEGGRIEEEWVREGEGGRIEERVGEGGRERTKV